MSALAQNKTKIIVTRRLPDAVHIRLSALFDAELNLDDQPMSRVQLKDALQRADVLVPTVTDEIDADILASAGPNFRMIANFGAGVDHIDRRAAHQAGIIVTNTPDVLTEDTADHVLALILAVKRRLVVADRLVRAGKFTGWTPTGLLGHRVRGKSLGIIGMGRIGQAVARRAHAFGLDVHYHNRRRVSGPIEKELHAQYWENLDAMLGQVDIVTVNCPSTQATRHLINQHRLNCMRPNSILINTSRGETVDEDALAKALLERRIAGAALDVYENEPSIHPDLLGLDSVILTPHIASATHESRLEMGEKVMINIRAMIDGHRCPNRVLPPQTLAKVS